MKQGWVCYLTFNKNGIARMTKSEPRLSSGEFGVKIRIAVPQNVFMRKFPEATIKVPEAVMIEPKVEVLAPEQAP